MRNIEIKARLEDLNAAEAQAAALSEKPALKLHQVDTYFNIPQGRLKLREKEGDERGAELIFYRRDDISVPKASEYEITEIPEPDETREELKSRFGVRTTVVKNRTVYLIHNARIHLDEVEGLGSFIEIEVVVTPDTSDTLAETLTSDLMVNFTIDAASLLDCSYCDLMEKNGKS
jgi:predicted adenylyl cyclase CyaB